MGAIEKLNAFISQVEAQMGKKLDSEMAIGLIDRAQEIIDPI